jgi:type V secretory pathway adhesin AidA
MVRSALFFMLALATLGLAHEGHNHGPDDDKMAPQTPAPAPAPSPAPAPNSNVNKAASEVDKSVKNNGATLLPVAGIAATLPVVVSFYSM